MSLNACVHVYTHTQSCTNKYFFYTHTHAQSYRWWLHQGRFWEVRDFSKGTTLDKDSALCLFHPTKNRLKSFIQFRWGQPKGLGVVIDDEASKKFNIPQRHRLFRVTQVELHACWHESHEVYESQDTQTDGEIVLADSCFHRNYSFLLPVKWVAR
jgi:hypothetical protein